MILVIKLDELLILDHFFEHVLVALESFYDLIAARLLNLLVDFEVLHVLFEYLFKLPLLVDLILFFFVLLEGALDVELGKEYALVVWVVRVGDHVLKVHVLRDILLQFSFIFKQSLQNLVVLRGNLIHHLLIHAFIVVTRIRRRVLHG